MLDTYLRNLADREFPDGYQIWPASLTRAGQATALARQDSLKVPDRALVVVYERALMIRREVDGTPATLLDDPAIVLQSDRLQESIASRLLLTLADDTRRYAYVDQAPVLHRGNIRHACQANGNNLNLRYVINYLVIEPQ